MPDRYRSFRRIVFVFFALLSIGVFYLQVVRHDFYLKKSYGNFTRQVPLQGLRGEIYDRNGIPIAVNRLSFDVVVDPYRLDKGKVFPMLAELMGVDEEEIAKRYKKGYIAPYRLVRVFEDIDRKTAILLMEHQSQLPNVHVDVSNKRFYPFGEIMAHITGYVGRIDSSNYDLLKSWGYSYNDWIGYAGLEKSYEAYLRGTSGSVTITVNSKGYRVEEKDWREPEKGSALYTSIDARMQEIVYAHMKGKKGAAVIMDLKTGGIVALVVFPSYDPNVFLEEGKAEEVKRLQRDKDAPLYNRAVSGAYALGSVFKIVTAAAGLSTGKIKSGTRYHCGGFFMLGNTRFGCTHSHGDENVVEGLKHSCNVFFYNVGLLVGAQGLYHFGSLFGLGQKTGIDLPYENSGLLPSKAWKRSKMHQPWYDGDTVNLSIGQGQLLASPLQALSIVNVIATNGKRVRPHLVEIVGDKKVDMTAYRDTGIDADTIGIIKKGLEAVVFASDGTAHNLFIPNLPVAGKTGTAQTSPSLLPHGWFAGYFPAYAPRYSAVVFLEHGESSHYAAQVLKDILLDLQKEGLI